MNIGTSNQTNIGLDRQNFKFDLNYDWIDKKDRKNKLSLINIEFVNNKNIINYFLELVKSTIKLNYQIKKKLT